MTAVTAFNDMMGQFLVELHKTFPEEKGIKKFMTSFDLLKSTNPVNASKRIWVVLVRMPRKSREKMTHSSPRTLRVLNFYRISISKNTGM